LTGHLYFSLHVKYQAYGYTRLIAESIHRASPEIIRSSKRYVSSFNVVTMSLMRLWHRHSYSMYTPCNHIHFIWSWTHLSHTYVQLISYVQMQLQCCFAVLWIPAQSASAMFLWI